MLRQVIIPILIIVVVVLAYMGVYMPVKKASLYININSNSAAFSSISDITQAFDKVFNYSSPIGQEETVKFFSNNMMALLSNEQINTRAAADSILDYLESNISEENFLHILNMADSYHIAYNRFGDQKYFDKAEDYYLKALDMGPKVPQPLHNLYTLYRDSGMTQKSEEIADIIVNLWPQYSSSNENSLENL